MNASIHHMASAQMHTDALRAALRDPRMPDIEKPRRSSPRRRRLLHRLRPALA